MPDARDGGTTRKDGSVMGNGIKLPLRGPLALRLWARVDKHADPDGCWLWTGSVSGLGYGRIRREDGRSIGVHRAAYELEVGPVPEGKELDHLCRVRNCVNPAHLEPVTHAENMLRGQTVAATNAVKTHCVNGHPLDGANLYIRPGDKGRECRTCRTAAVQRHRAGGNG